MPMSNSGTQSDQLTINLNSFDSPSITDSELLISERDFSKILADERAFFINYVEKYWLNRYHLMKRTSQRLHVPSITAPTSDTPTHGTGSVSKQVENYALKSVTASEWIKLFHESVDRLPDELKDLIKRKYLNRRGDGQPFEDDYVYDSMHISRSKYYELKPRALEELGRILFALSEG